MANKNPLVMLKVHLTQTEIIQRNVLLGLSCEKLRVNDPQPLPRGFYNISEPRVLLLFTHRKGIDTLMAKIPEVLDQLLLACQPEIVRS